MKESTANSIGVLYVRSIGGLHKGARRLYSAGLGFRLSGFGLTFRLGRLRITWSSKGLRKRHDDKIHIKSLCFFW